MKINDEVIVNKQHAVVVGLPGDLYFNDKINKDMKVPLNMVCVDTKHAVLVFPQSQVKLAA